jgi:DNA-binding NarL/FixJ family response regulator
VTRIVLVDDHTLVRAGLRTLLDSLPGIEVVAEAGDGSAGLEAVRAHKPDVLITDVTMGGMSGLELLEQVRREAPATRVIVLSMFASDEYVMRALKAGASAYLLKDAAESELEVSLQAALRGETYLSPGASQRLVERVTGAGEPDPLASLTPRQREILRLVAEGVHAKEIAHRLRISRKTVDAHRAEIMERLGIRDVPGLVRLAMRAGLISSDGE